MVRTCAGKSECGCGPVWLAGRPFGVFGSLGLVVRSVVFYIFSLSLFCCKAGGVRVRVRGKGESVRGWWVRVLNTTSWTRQESSRGGSREAE